MRGKDFISYFVLVSFPLVWDINLDEYIGLPSIFCGGPAWVSVLTCLKSAPIPKPIVDITTRSGVSAGFLKCFCR